MFRLARSVRQRWLVQAFHLLQMYIIFVDIEHTRVHLHIYDSHEIEIVKLI